MHTVKGPWVGQTFALAKCNDSGGKKARIRRSKEERKEMVQSFIKKYQKSNNGSFPSLNLTHKEVGGSFYTVREIVRDIIQENRVLGPAKLATDNCFLEKYPIRSISVEPEGGILSSDEPEELIDLAHNHHHISTEDQALNSTENFPGSGHHCFEVNNGLVIKQRTETVENDSDLARLVVTDKKINEGEGSNYGGSGPEDQTFNGGLVNKSSSAFEENKVLKGCVFKENDANLERRVEAPVKNKEVDELVFSDVTCDHNKNMKEGPISNFNGTASTHLSFKEGLPINTNNCSPEEEKDAGGESKFGGAMEEGGTDVQNMSEDKKSDVMADIVVETFPLRPLPRTIYDSDGDSNDLRTRNMKQEGESGNFVIERIDVVERSSNLTNESAEKKYGQVVNDGETSSKISSGSMAKESIVLNHRELEINDANTSMIEPMNISNGTYSKNANPVDGSSRGLSESDEATTIERKPVIQRSGCNQKGSNSLLSRINLESWEGTSETSGRSEINPLLALFKAFTTAFVKFWTE